MRSVIDKLYFFALLCANANTLGTVFGGHAALSAGGSQTALSSGESDPVLLAINIALAIATVFLVFSKLPAIFTILRGARFLLASYLLATVSMIWSVNRAATFRSGLYIWLYLMSAAYIALQFDIEEIIHLIGDFLALMALLCIPAQYILPHDRFEGADWSGIFLQKNELGIAMAIGVLALIAANRPWNLYRIGAITLCTSLLLLSVSTTAIFATAAAVAVLLYHRLPQRSRILILIAFMGAIAVALIAVSNLSAEFSDVTGKNLTLTGRTAIWGLVLQQVATHPILGFGYSAFWSTNAESVNEFITNGFKPGQAHNGYLEIMLDTGALGLLLILLLARDALRRSRRLRRAHNHPSGEWLLPVTVALLIHCCAEVDFLRSTVSWFVFLIAYLSCCRYEFFMESEFFDDGADTEEQLPVGALS
jgi:O-antigen ligase